MAGVEARSPSCAAQEPLERLLALHEVALASMAHGLLLWSQDGQVELFNRRFVEMYGLSADTVRNGMSVRDLLAHSAAVGNFPYITPEKAWRLLVERMNARVAFGARHRVRNGRMIAVKCRPIADGRWVAVYEDVTEQDRLETALRLQAERTERAVALMSHGLSMFDADERLIVANEAYYRIYDLDPAVVKPGVTLHDIVTHTIERGSDYGKPLEETYRERLLNARRPGVSTGQTLLRNGRTVEITSRQTSDGGWVSTHEDITERRRYEDALREQNLRFDTALGNMAQGLVMFDENLRIVVCNQRYLEMWHYDPAVVRPGATLFDVLRHSIELGNHGPDADPQSNYDIYRARLEGEQSAVIQRRGDGRMIAVRPRSMTNGGWVVTYEDVTESAQAAEALREQNLRFDAALDNMAQGLVMFDADWHILVCNRNFLEMFGFAPEIVKPGATLMEVLRHSVEIGNHGPSAVPEEIHARYIARRDEAAIFRRQGDGRQFLLRSREMKNGGRLVTYDDVTEREQAAAALHEQNLRFDAAVNNMSQGLCMFDAEHRLIVCNEKYLTIFRADRAVVRPGVTLQEVFEHGVSMGIYPGLAANELLARRLAVVNQRRLISYDQVMADGRTVAITISPMGNGGWVGTFEDVTESRRIETERLAALEELREQHQRFDAALSNMSHGLCMVGRDHRLIVCNKRFTDMLGLAPGTIRSGDSLRDLVAASVAVGNYGDATVDEAYTRYLSQLQDGVHTVQRHLPDGRTLLITRRPMEGGGWVAIYEDITERRKAEERIAHMARHDALTGLPNRVLFREKMAEGLVRVEEQDGAMAVLCLDLDHFKTVNDTLGHPMGDRLLSAVAERLVAVASEGDTIARLGGDEFAILQSGPQPQSAELLARRIVEVLDEPIIIDDHEINTGASIGIAVAPNDGTAADHLIKCADLALYRAKADGRARYRFFEIDMDTRVQEKRALEIDLRRALANSEFELYYQPQVRAADCALTGMEVLLRWNHAARGRVPPSEFIPVAEETGLVVPIGEWVLRRACVEAARWPADIKVAVNLSPAQFKSRGLVAMVASALAVAGLPPSRLELEITEAVLLQDDELTLTMLHQLRALGVRFSMDDFGTGYSSLSYLRSFPFDKIKIDRSFIMDLDRGKDSAAIIRAIAGLGASLGIDTTAEGVETAEQFERVRRDGCTEIQGYYFSPPRPAAEIFEIMARFRQEKAVA